MEKEAGTTEQDEAAWKEVMAFFEKRFGKKPDLQSIIFLVGHRELGRHQVKFSKEQKQDLMHVGVCTLLSKAGYYAYTGHDQEGWPHFEYNREMPKLSATEQELLLKKMIIQYIQSL